MELARERAYVLFGRLIRYGISADLEPAAGAALGDVAVEPGEHHDLFGFEAPPYESFVLSPDRLLGGEISGEVARTYAAGGFSPDVADVAPDHLGVELAYLGWLCGARGDALRDGVEAEALLGLQRSFLEEHLLRWLPAYAASLGGNRTYVRTVRLAAELVIEHARSLGASPSFALPEPPDVEREGLRDIAELLCTPCFAGGVLTRGTIRALGDLPRGFGERPHELKTLLLSAARFGQLDEVLAALDAELVRWTDGLRGPVGPWRDRIARTRSLLTGMRAAAETA